MLILAPLLGLLFLFGAGAGLAVMLAPTFPRDVQVALAPIVASAALAVASALAAFLPWWLGVAGVTVILLGTTAHRLRSAHICTAALVAPISVAVAAIVLAGAPIAASGSWHLRSYIPDPYFWVSQARSLDAAVAPAPANIHPDRIAHERTRQQGWAVALPVATRVASVVLRRQPDRIYGLIEAFLTLPVVLSTYLAARAVLGWGIRVSSGAALITAASPTMLYSVFAGYDQPIVGVGFALAMLVALYRLLRFDDRPAGLLAALAAAAALATYRLPFVPSLFAAALTVTALAIARSGLGATIRRLRAPLLVFAVIALPSLVSVAIGETRFASRQASEVGWSAIPHGLLSEAVGMSWRDFEFQLPHEPWRAIQIGFAAALVGLGLARSWRGRDFLAPLVILMVVAATASDWLGFTGYYSYKLYQYGVPFIVLVGVAAVVGRPKLIPALCVWLALLVVADIHVYRTAAAHLDDPTPFARLAANPEVRRASSIGVDSPDAWAQVWLAYYLPRKNLSVPQPSIYFTRIGQRRVASSFLHGRPVLVIGACRDSSLQRIDTRHGSYCLMRVRN